jgi:hypothetical protein
MLPLGNQCTYKDQYISKTLLVLKWMTAVQELLRNRSRTLVGNDFHPPVCRVLRGLFRPDLAMPVDLIGVFGLVYC